jgi:hypothetical protein
LEKVIGEKAADSLGVSFKITVEPIGQEREQGRKINSTVQVDLKRGNNGNKL